MNFSIPSWNYDESYYHALMEGASYCIKTNPVKGRGLFSRRKIKEGEIVHEETALCCSQNLDDVLNVIPVCGNCLLSLESPRRCVARVTKNKDLPSKIPYVKLDTYSRPVQCTLSDIGCSMVFCSVRCREAAWSRFHFAGCRGRMNDDQKEAFDTFLHYNWGQQGVNYSDTVFLAFRFVCMTLTNIRLHRQSLELAYRPVSQLIRAPLKFFRFTYLFSDAESEDADDGSNDENFGSKSGIDKVGGDIRSDGDNNDDEDRRRRYARWCAFLKRRAAHNTDGENDGEEEFLATGVQLLDHVLRFSEEERSLFTKNEWSNLLGAILLNGQERSPPSNYDGLKSAVGKMPGGIAAIDAFEKTVQAAGVDPQKLYYSSRGQGIYTIGCLFNHSCEPNVQVLYSRSRDETLTIEALRDIDEGAELHISYIDETLPYPDRQKQLYEHYLFVCLCPKCVRESSSWVCTTKE